MIFNSLEFFIFFTITMGLYGLTLKHERARDLFLLGASYIFYSAWYWEYSFLILASTVVDYFIGRRMHNASNQKVKKQLLLLSLSFNLGLLALFKYFNFFANTAVTTMDVFGFQIDPIQHELLLPIGISFYTFQTLSYTLDIYRGRLKPEHSFTKFAVFVAFFPQLVAGPIVRAKDFLPQLHKKLTFSNASAALGMFLIISGLVKKVLIADPIALMAVDPVFENPGNYSSLDLLSALYGYTIQIYCDFSGYSDVAIGLALLLGFHLPLNFNRPYIAKDPSEFWKRWHISLSSWLQDYLYISLGGSRSTRLFIYRNLLLTMVLGGLWHGAAMNFLLWGAFHGLILIAFRPFRKITAQAQGIKKLLLITLTFHLIVFGWLLFRVPDLATFNTYMKGLLAFNFDNTQLSGLFFCMLFISFFWHWFPAEKLRIPLRDLLIHKPIWLQAGCYAVLLFIFAGMSVDTPQFLYFQF